MADGVVERLRGRYAAKLTVSLLLIAALLVSYGAVAQQETSTQVRDNAEERLVSQADLRSGELDAWMASVKKSARTTSSHPAVVSGSDRERSEHLRSLMDSDRVPEAVVAVHYIDGESRTITASSNEEFVGVSPAEQGAPFAENPPEFDGPGDTHVSEPFEVAVVEFPIVSVLSPVKNGEGMIVYMINVEKRGAAMFDGASDGQELVVLGSNNRYIAHPDPERIGQQPDSEVEQSLASEALSGGAGFSTAADRATGYAPMEEAGWVVMVREPAGQAFALSESVRSSFAGLILIGVVSLALVGVTVGSSTAIALRQLSAKAQAMAEGDLDVSLSSRRSDEIGQLYASFDAMRDSLRAQIEEAETAQREAEQARQEAEAMTEQLQETAGEYEAVMRSAADNDLSARVETEGRHEAMAAVGRELNTMLDGIESTVARLEQFAADVVAIAEEVDQRTAEVKTAGEEVSAATDEISEGATEQTERLSEAAEETENLSASAEEIAATVDTISDTSREAAEAGEAGREAAAGAIDRMNAVVDDADAAVERIEDLEAQMTEIGEIVDVIREIADQTNTLALNASIEAARAGAESDGFAVVADEIKSLAEQTKESAVEIEDRIERIQNRTGETADTVREASEGVTDGAATVEEVVEELDRVVELIDEADQGVQEITAATDEQAMTAQTVSETVESVATISRETTDQAGTASTAADQQTNSLEAVSERVNELHGQAGELEQLLASFEIDDSKGADAARDATSAPDPTAGADVGPGGAAVDGGEPEPVDDDGFELTEDR